MESTSARLGSGTSLYATDTSFSAGSDRQKAPFCELTRCISRAGPHDDSWMGRTSRMARGA
eukprot:2114062-Prymnesium_polylepis.1